VVNRLGALGAGKTAPLITKYLNWRNAECKNPNSLYGKDILVYSGKIIINDQSNVQAKENNNMPYDNLNFIIRSLHY